MTYHPWPGVCGAALLVLTSGGCSVYRPMEQVTPTIAVPGRFSSGGAGAAQDQWWRAFEDEQLNQLVERALHENRQLRSAWARLEQMRQVANMSGASRWPQGDAVIAGERQRLEGDQGSVTSAGATQQLSQGDGATVDSFSASMEISYQLDLFRRIATTQRADELTAQASRKDVETTALIVASSVVELWVGLAEQRAIHQLLEEQLEVGNEYLHLVETRFANGLASALDVYQQRLQVESTRAQLPRVEARTALLVHQLAVIQGLPPRMPSPLPQARMPALQPAPALELPATVILQRPDVAAAQLRLLAADHRVAAAVADRFPSVGISLTGASQASQLSQLFDGWLTSLAAHLLGPVFDGGRRKAEVARTRAAVEQAFADWESTILVCLREIEDALATEQSLRKSEEILTAQLELAEVTLERSRSRYLAGLTDYLNVLTSLQSLQQLERARITTQKELLSNRVKLHLALGGVWPTELTDPHREPVS